MKPTVAAYRQPGLAVKVGILSDPLVGLRQDHDTTVALMGEFASRHHELWHAEQRDLGLLKGAAVARMRRVVSCRSGSLAQGEERELPLSSFDLFLMRKDPPVDVPFLLSTQLVEMGAQGPLFVNRPASLRSVNEKLVASSFTDLVPPTIVTSAFGDVLRFLEQEPVVVCKPLDLYGGRGIFILNRDDPNVLSLLELATQDGCRQVMVQRYLPESRQGDKRILLLGGNPIGAILRMAPTGDFRCNLRVGGEPRATTLDSRDRLICSRISPFLREAGLEFVGIDVIGGFLTEINVTSPTGLVELEHLGGSGATAQVVNHLERLVEPTGKALPSSDAN
ncbi:MAG: glutathione synthase [Deltaproteobacteria bacterium]